MPEWVSWSGAFHAPFNESRRPRDVYELIAAVSGSSAQEGRAHAEGSRWAFSAPAYCDDVMIDTSDLNQFPKLLQHSIRKPSLDERYLVAVEAGIKIRDLYRALAFDQDRGYGGPRPDVPDEAGRIWTLPVLGGAGGQSLAGAISTGTHGGDAARPPLSDAVRAILLVASAGRLLLIEPTDSAVVDGPELSAHLGIPVESHQNTALFNAALVSVGRFGIVWAYVLEVHDESRVAIVEERTRSTWQAIQANLAQLATAAASNDEFFQVAINPLRDDDGLHACFITRHFIVAGHPTDAGETPAHMHVSEARRTTGCALALQVLSSPRAHAALATLPVRLPAFGLPGVGPVLATQIAARIAEIGTIRPNGDRYLNGDALADVLKDIRWLDPSWTVLRTLHAELYENEQRDHIVHPHEPWKVKGTRFEIADFFDYDSPESYRGDSVELFFEVDPSNPAALSSTIDALLAVFDVLRAENLQTAPYFAIRFMAQTRATLGLARWPLTCSVEVAMLRGLLGNTRLLRLLQDVALARQGTVHWGQQNDLDPVDVAAGFGTALDDFRSQIPTADSFRLFRNRFTLSHGLEPVTRPTWEEWTDLGQVGRGAAAIPLGFEIGAAMEVFARDLTGTVQVLPLDSGGRPTAPWRSVRPEPVGGRPSVFRGVSGRHELFSVDGEVLKHTYQEAAGGATWSRWNTKGLPDPGRFDPDRPEVSVAAHGDGRLEVFGKAGWERNFHLAHTWARVVDGPWETVFYRGSNKLASMPCAVNRRLADGRDLLVVVAANTDGEIMSMQQTGTADDAHWTDWQSIGSGFRTTAPGGPVLVAPPGQPLHLYVVGPRDRLFLGTTTTSGPGPGPWDFTDLGIEVDPMSRIAALFHGGRIWVATRDPGGDVLCGGARPGNPIILNVLDAFTFEDVALGGYPRRQNVQVVVRAPDGRLYGRRLSPY